MERTIEEKVSREILQQSEEMTVGGKTYAVAPPSVATLIMASEAASRLPHLALDAQNIVAESLRTAKDCRGIGEIIAILLLGAKRIRQSREEPKKRRFLGSSEPQDIVSETATAILEGCSPRELSEVATRLLSRMELADFFGLTTFLQEATLTRPTRKVENATTASGQS